MRESLVQQLQGQLSDARAQVVQCTTAQQNDDHSIAIAGDLAQELVRDLRRQIEEKDATIATLRLQTELLGVRKGLERQLHEAQDLDSRCQALKDSVAQVMAGIPSA